MNYLSKIPREKWEEEFKEYKERFEKAVTKANTDIEKIQLLKKIQEFTAFLRKNYEVVSLPNNEEIEKFRQIFIFHIIIGSGVNPDDMDEFDFYNEESSIRKFIDEL